MNRYITESKAYRSLLYQLYLIIPLFFVLLFAFEWFGIHLSFAVVIYLIYGLWLQHAVRSFRCPRCKKAGIGLFSGPAWKTPACHRCGLRNGQTKDQT